MDRSELYSLSSVADDSSDKSDSSVGLNFYQDSQQKFPHHEENSTEKKENLSEKRDPRMSTSGRIIFDDCGGDTSRSKNFLNTLAHNPDYEYCKTGAKLALFENKKLREELVLSLTRSQNREQGPPQQQFAHNFSMARSEPSKELYPNKNFTNSNSQVEEAAKTGGVFDQRVLQRSHVASFERLRGSGILAENTGILERQDSRNFQPGHIDALGLERMRQAQFGAKDVTVEAHGRGWSATLQRDVVVTQMQESQQQQPGMHQQPKSFTIDAILGLRNSQREKHRNQQCRKHQPYDASIGKNASANSCTSGNDSSNGNGNGKLKRVRTIFTSEQLERLEGEFARQQYMVGPERLYLAHALRLTEAQVKVWFQNRRIKWRKLNHEQQSQRLHEIHQQMSLSSLEPDDSIENGEW